MLLLNFAKSSRVSHPPFLVEIRQRAEGKRQKKDKTSGKKGVIKADLVLDAIAYDISDSDVRSVGATLAERCNLHSIQSRSPQIFS
ncbi:MAG TPA: hypothetical protein V6C85_24450 [Allocoleopsis sp.]